MTIAIIDSDSICVACAAQASQTKDESSTRKDKKVFNAEEVRHTYGNVKRKMLDILERTSCMDYRAILTANNDPTAFRYKLYSDYKANRRGQDRPLYELQAKDYLKIHWDAEVVTGIEADDACCILQYEYYNSKFMNEDDIREAEGKVITPAILCHIDKDLNQIPGMHYNYMTHEFYYITPIQGLRNLYLQMLTGDTADNVPRIKKGWRQAEAEEQILKALTEQELYEIVNSEFKSIRDDISDIDKHIKWLGDLLYLRKYEVDEYKIPEVVNEN